MMSIKVIFPQFEQAAYNDADVPKINCQYLTFLLKNISL